MIAAVFGAGERLMIVLTPEDVTGLLVVGALETQVPNGRPDAGTLGVELVMSPGDDDDAMLGFISSGTVTRDTQIHDHREAQ